MPTLPPSSDAPRLAVAAGAPDVGAIVRVVAHELKTPLTSIKAALQLLSHDAPGWPADRQELLAVAQRNAQRLSGLTQSFLDIVALTEGTLELHPTRLDLRPLLERAVSEARARLKRPDISLVAAPDLPPVMADEKRVLQVLEELLENAAKCSPEGSGIEVGATARGPEAVLSVADRGKGIPEAHREAVLRPFFQVDASATRDVPGLGLGLAICRGLVEKHGGSIRIEGREGPGTVITFTLPVA